MHKITSIISIKLVNFTLLILLITATQIGYAQAEKKIGDINALKEPSIEEYEQLVFEATQYLLSNPVDEKSAKFVSSSKIVCFWMNQDTGYGIPLGGNFYYKLRNTDNQQYFYAVSIVNYLLDQKINHNRILPCIAIEGETYKHQEDVKEVRLKAAEIFLGFAKKPKNKIKLTIRSKKYLKFYRKGTLNEKFQEELDELPTKKDVASPFITSVRPN